MTNLDIYNRAERNDDGDLVVTRESNSDLVDETTNLTHLFTPGKRKSNSERLLKVEAAMRADPDKPTPDNPAFPVTPELGKKISEWCEEQGIEPAWVDGPAVRDDL